MADFVKLMDVAIDCETLLESVILNLPAGVVYTNIFQENPDFAAHLTKDIYVARIAAVSAINLVKLPPQAAILEGGDFVLAINGQFIQEQYPPYLSTETEPFRDLIRNRPAFTQIDGEAILLARFGIMTWGHWLCEILPKAVLAEAKHPGRFKFVLPDEILAEYIPWPRLIESLKAYGLCEDRLILIKLDQSYRFTNLFAVTNIWSDHVMHPGAAAAMRDTIRLPSQPPAHRRIAISRLDRHGREIQNMAEIEQLLKSNGFAAYSMGQMKFTDQVSLFRQSDVVFGILGSDVANILYAPAGVKLITVAPANFGDRFFYALVLDRKGQQIDLRGPVTKRDEILPHRSTFEMDPRQIVRAIEIFTNPASKYAATSMFWSNGIQYHLETGHPNKNGDDAVKQTRPAYKMPLTTLSAADARVIIAITFYYRPDRLKYLFEVLLSLSQFHVKSLEVMIVTNTENVEHLNKIKRILAVLCSTNKFFSIQSFPEVDRGSNKLLLTWSHKKIISDVFLASRSNLTHFIYLEEDILFTFSNFQYFLQHRPLLETHGLIPSFVRVEYNSDRQFAYLNDLAEPTPKNLPIIKAGSYSFQNLWWPYCALFVLDQALGHEYVNSDAFALEKSGNVNSGWGLAERAAMGLCFVNVPDGFRFRHVVPINQKRFVPETDCWVRHLPNNYTNNPTGPLGHIAADEAFS